MSASASSSRLSPKALGPSNPLSPELLTPTERIAELGALLAAGLIRLHAAQSSRTSAVSRDSLLDCAPDQSGHATALNETEEGE